jgi:hypothetical protein
MTLTRAAKRMDCVPALNLVRGLGGSWEAEEGMMEPCEEGLRLQRRGQPRSVEQRAGSRRVETAVLIVPWGNAPSDHLRWKWVCLEPPWQRVHTRRQDGLVSSLSSTLGTLRE